MPTTEADIVVRVTNALDGVGYPRAVGLDFSRLPVGATDSRCLVTLQGQTPKGGFGYSEEARAILVVEVARSIGNDYATTWSALAADLRTILETIVADGLVGDYAIEDVGRTMDIRAPSGANFLIGALRLPINFEALLV